MNHKTEHGNNIFGHVPSVFSVSGHVLGAAIIVSLLSSFYRKSHTPFSHHGLNTYILLGSPVLCALLTSTHLLLLGGRCTYYFTDVKTPKSLSNLSHALRCGPESVHLNELGFKKEPREYQPDWVAGRDKTGG